MNNRNGLDASYFAGKLALVVAGIDSYTPQELARELARLAKTADAEAAAGEFTHPAPSQPSAEALVQAALEAAANEMNHRSILIANTTDAKACYANDERVIRALSARQIIAEPIKAAQHSSHQHKR